MSAVSEALKNYETNAIIFLFLGGESNNFGLLTKNLHQDYQKFKKERIPQLFQKMWNMNPDNILIAGEPLSNHNDLWRNTHLLRRLDYLKSTVQNSPVPINLQKQNIQNIPGTSVIGYEGRDFYVINRSNVLAKFYLCCCIPLPLVVSERVYNFTRFTLTDKKIAVYKAPKPLSLVVEHDVPIGSIHIQHEEIQWTTNCVYACWSKYLHCQPRINGKFYVFSICGCCIRQAYAYTRWQHIDCKPENSPPPQSMMD